MRLKYMVIIVEIGTLIHRVDC